MKTILMYMAAAIFAFIIMGINLLIVNIMIHYSSLDSFKSISIIFGIYLTIYIGRKLNQAS